jgi:hypothetical protein
MSGETTQYVSDSANKGSSIGGNFGPIGGIVGGIIGVAKGLFLSGKAKKASKFRKLAEETKRKQQTMRLALQRREVVRNLRFARAQAVAAGTSEGNVRSSATAGAAGSVTGQGISALEYFDAQVGLDNKAQSYLAEAARMDRELAKHAAVTSGANTAAQLGTDIYGVFQQNNQNQGSPYASIVHSADNYANTYTGPTDAIDNIKMPTLGK